MGGDTQLKKHVEDELSWGPSVDEASIGITVKNAAERAVMRIHGVKGLASELQVSLPGAHERTDEDIARAALNVVVWNAVVPKDAIKVKVTKGFVTLSGIVEWSYQNTARNARYPASLESKA